MILIKAFFPIYSQSKATTHYSVFNTIYLHSFPVFLSPTQFQQVKNSLSTWSPCSCSKHICMLQHAHTIFFISMGVKSSCRQTLDINCIFKIKTSIFRFNGSVGTFAKFICGGSLCTASLKNVPSLSYSIALTKLVVNSREQPQETVVVPDRSKECLNPREEIIFAYLLWKMSEKFNSYWFLMVINKLVRKVNHRSFYCVCLCTFPQVLHVLLCQMSEKNDITKLTLMSDELIQWHLIFTLWFTLD